MKITGQKPLSLNELATGKAQDKATRNHTGRVAQDSTGTSSVTNHASQTASKIKETLRAEPDIRPDRVEEVKEKIRTGKYKVEPEQLAESMLMASLKEDLEKP